MTTNEVSTQWIRAKHAPRCCNDCGRMALIFRVPRTLREAFDIAIQKRLGTPVALDKRIRDMCASGLLVPYSHDE